jgi:outer membrane protein TolC
MTFSRTHSFIRLLLLLLLPLLNGHSFADTELTLAQAEKIALANNPQVLASQAKALALKDSAVANAQLADPKIKLGIFNLPTDSFDFDQEPSTQVRLGVSQAFSRGKTREYKQKQTEWESIAEQERSQAISLNIKRNVRLEFLELYYQIQAEEIIKKSRDIFLNLVKTTQAHYGSGRVSQQDVLSAELELSKLDDRAVGIQDKQSVSRATLHQWIGRAANRGIVAVFPVLPALVSKSVFNDSLQHHVEMKMEMARINAWNQNLNVVREQYKPSWNLGVEYRSRFGDNLDGSRRSDMVAVMVTADLPLFTNKRQDKRLSESQHQAAVAQLDRDNRLRELQSTLERDYANWLRLSERETLYKERLLSESSANAAAALNAYQNGVVQFSSLMRAQLTELDVRLQDIRIRVDKVKAQARLLYLASGEK